MNLVSSLKLITLNKVFQNSLWGVISSLFQNIVFSIFFIILARKLDTSVLSSYIISNTFYGLMLSFSSLGMGQWFVRKMVNDSKNSKYIHLFLSVQLCSGIIFYFIQNFIVVNLYEEKNIHQISYILGFNIIFDNILYVTKTINVINNDQRKTFIITSSEALMKLIFAYFIWLYGTSVLFIVFTLVLLRFISVVLFLQYGLPQDVIIRFRSIIYSFSFSELVQTVHSNKYFILIGSISVLFWSFGNIIVSKLIGLTYVPHFEISYKLFTMAELIPLVFSASIFPVLTQKYKSDYNGLVIYFRKVFWIYAAYGFLSFMFILFFADLFIPKLFGVGYIDTSKYSVQLFFTMLLFPTSLLQANLLIAMGYERRDMWYNLFMLISHIIISLALLSFFKDLTYLNLSIFLSFLLFHLSQDFFLLKKRILTKYDISFFYIIIIFFTLFFHFWKLITR
jgi:O-antigen/teichoic acid export membrane protein